MNIFYLSEDPIEAARFQCDIHVIKMTTECGQILSTAHRVLDGEQTTRLSDSGRRMKYWYHPELDESIYKATHVNHPSNIWTREGIDNYRWLYQHFVGLSNEFHVRYEKPHGAFIKLGDVLSRPPQNIPVGGTPIRLATGDVDLGDAVETYREFYRQKRERMKMKWKNGNVPTWFGSEDRDHQVSDQEV